MFFKIREPNYRFRPTHFTSRNALARRKRSADLMYCVFCFPCDLRIRRFKYLIFKLLCKPVPLAISMCVVSVNRIVCSFLRITQHRWCTDLFIFFSHTVFEVQKQTCVFDKKTSDGVTRRTLSAWQMSSSDRNFAACFNR